MIPIVWDLMLCHWRVRPDFLKSHNAFILPVEQSTEGSRPWRQGVSYSLKDIASRLRRLCVFGKCFNWNSTRHYKYFIRWITNTARCPSLYVRHFPMLCLTSSLPIPQIRVGTAWRSWEMLSIYRFLPCNSLIAQPSSPFSTFVFTV